MQQQFFETGEVDGGGTLKKRRGESVRRNPRKLKRMKNTYNGEKGKEWS